MSAFYTQQIFCIDYSVHNCVFLVQYVVQYVQRR